MQTINVYTDGACKNNGYSNAIAGIGVYFSDGDSRNVSRRIDGKQTNNTAELLAIIEVFKILHESISTGIHVNIYSDSEYSIKCATSYGSKLNSKNWSNGSKKIPNLELVQKIYRLFVDNSNVKIIHVKAHTSKKDVHSMSNFHADRLANLAVNDIPTNSPIKTKVEPIQTTGSKSISLEKTIHENIFDKLIEIEKRISKLEKSCSLILRVKEK